MTRTQPMQALHAFFRAHSPSSRASGQPATTSGPSIAPLARRLRPSQDQLRSESLAGRGHRRRSLEASAFDIPRQPVPGGAAAERKSSPSLVSAPVPSPYAQLQGRLAARREQARQDAEADWARTPAGLFVIEEDADAEAAALARESRPALHDRIRAAVTETLGANAPHAGDIAARTRLLCEEEARDEGEEAADLGADGIAFHVQAAIEERRSALLARMPYEREELEEALVQRLAGIIEREHGTCVTQRESVLASAFAACWQLGLDRGCLGHELDVDVLTAQVDAAMLRQVRQENVQLLQDAAAPQPAAD